MDEEPKFFNPYAEIRTTENRLPHWEQDGATYFITFRLADSVPKELLDRWAEERECWLRLHPPPHTPEIEREYHTRFTGAIERCLDEGHGACVLRRPEAANVVGNALQHFEGERCHQIGWIVMPNHVHALFIPRPPWSLERLLHSWKSFTAHALHKQLGTSGDFWQRDYFDRLVRDQAHFANCVRYIRRNPAKAGLRTGEFLLWESEITRGVED
jgi:putative transposase